MVKVPIMVVEAVSNIQVDKTVDMEIVEWVLDMAVAQAMEVVLSTDTVVTVDAANLQEADMVTAVQIGDLDLVVLVAETGALVAMEVVPVTVDILKINI